MRLLVTGGAGFLGSHLVDRLALEGHDVDVVDDLSGGSLSNLARARAEKAGELKIHQLDVRAPEFAELVARKKPEVVYHLAAPTAVVGAVAAVEVGLGGLTSVLEAAVGAGAAKFVMVVPALGYYGPPAPRDLPVREGSPHPVTLGGVIARAGVDLLGVYREHHALEFTVLALAHVYGPRQRPASGVVAAFAAARAQGAPGTVRGDGRQTRDFVYVDDVVDALARSATRGGGLVINVGTGQQTTIRELYKTVFGPEAGALRTAADADEPGRFAVSPARARIHLGWAPWTPLADGLRLTLDAWGVSS